MDSKKAIKSVAKKTVKKKINKQFTKRGLDTPIMKQMLQKHSPYYNSIISPLDHPGAKIPDNCVVQTFPNQCIQRIQVAANAQGISGLVLRFGTLGAAADFFTTAGTATLAALTYNNNTKAYAANINGIVANLRLVSGMVIMSYQGTALNNSGRCSTIFYPSSMGGGGNVQTIPPVVYASDIAPAPYLATFPMREGVARVRYLPLDPLSYMFTKPLGSSITGSASSVGYATILCDGMVANQVVEYTIVENYECIPLNNAMNLLTPTLSKSDPLELSETVNEIASDPWLSVRVSPGEIQAGSATTPVTTGSSVVADHPLTKEPGTFFDKVLSGISASLPVIEKVGSSIGKVAPILGGLLA